VHRSRLRLVVADDDDRFATLITTLVEADGRFEVVARARNGRRRSSSSSSTGPTAC